MKSNELRIGNYVTYSNEHNIPVKIKGLNSDAVDTAYRKFLFYDKIFPIPLTEDWLIKFGFEKHKSITFDWDFEWIMFTPKEYSWEIGVKLGNYPINNPNYGCVSILHFQDEEVNAIPKDLLDKEEWTEKDIKRASEYTETYKKWRQPIAYYIHSVHQLQNLYFALTGEELTETNKPLSGR